jgi:hypothetical protein
VLARVLAEHRQNSRFTGLEDFVFAKPDGSPLNPDVLRRDVLYPALDRLRIPRPKVASGFHAFRHTAGSVVEEQTGRLKLAQRFLRHSNLSTTADWGYWSWSGDSKSVLMAKVVPEPGEQPGIYRLNIADGKWALVAPFNGLSVSSDWAENLLSITPDGRVAMMSDTSVVQIYSMRWNPQ